MKSGNRYNGRRPGKLMPVTRRNAGRAPGRKYRIDTIGGNMVPRHGQD